MGKIRTNHKNNRAGYRRCIYCKLDFPATIEYFYNDKSRSLGISYDCRVCLSIRKKGKDKRRSRANNPESKEKQRIRAAKYRKTIKGRAIGLRNTYRQHDECNLTIDEFIFLIQQPCFHCGTTDVPIGLDRIDNSFGHIKGNVVPSCRACNFARGDRFTFKEMQKIGKVIRKILEGRKIIPIQNEGSP